MSFVPGLVSVKDKRRLMFAVVDAEIDATQFVGLRRMSKEEKERDDDDDDDDDDERGVNNATGI